ncbi:MAG: GTPase HflX, partial [Candidatus Izemoplasmataceae bacterium]
MKNAILVGVDYYPKNKISIYMEELRALTQTLNIDVKAIFTQDGKQASAQYKIGTGKVEELKEYIDNASIELVIFNDELTGSQIRNLEAALDKPVIDRTLLILDIFAKRAKTKEAMLQVEVAQLKYMLPRLTSLHASFEKQQGGIGSRGPGEKKIELDRRKIENEINHLQKELSNIVQVRQSNRKQRKNSLIKTVAIVGYT